MRDYLSEEILSREVTKQLQKPVKQDAMVPTSIIRLGRTYSNPGLYPCVLCGLFRAHGVDSGLLPILVHFGIEDSLSS